MTSETSSSEINKKLTLIHFPFSDVEIFEDNHPNPTSVQGLEEEGIQVLK